MENNPFSVQKRLKSFVYAFHGVKLLVQTQHNAWIHLVAILVTSIGAYCYAFSAMEWIILVLCFGMVLAAEAVNSAIEVLANKVEPNQDPLIKQTKDIAAGAVLLTAIAAAVVGCILFIPKIFNL